MFLKNSAFGKLRDRWEHNTRIHCNGIGCEDWGLNKTGLGLCLSAGAGSSGNE